MLPQPSRRGEVRRLLDGEIEASASRGGDRRSVDFQISVTDLKRETRDHIIARLKRHAPEPPPTPGDDPIPC